ncbi:MAG: tRNA (adenosine(37)-N6)-dimethylallyltransferase MiaA [Alphaproteobacteria bacterium]|nr:tRNA (adenosine(37)-N6)-dimethylallyltransferase MiaA [Alphaproteobacteria bacterium]
MIKPLNKEQPDIIVIGGPTTSGKTNIGVILAEEMPAVIINADAMQMYHEIPIISGQPTREEKRNIPHELYGVLPVATHGSVFIWLEMVCKQIDAVRKAGKTPILIGGTGMYIASLYKGISPVPAVSLEVKKRVRSDFELLGNERFYELLLIKDPQIKEHLHVGDSQRMVRAMEVLEETGESLYLFQKMPASLFYSDDQFKLFFLELPREKLYDRCNKRFVAMVEAGAIAEVKNLDGLGLDPNLPAMRAHGVPELLHYIHETIPLDKAIETAQKNTRHYVKRQFTWFKHQLPQATRINAEDPHKAVQEIRKLCLL